MRRKLVFPFLCLFVLLSQVPISAGTFSESDSLASPVNDPIIICPSGVGEVICEIYSNTPVDIEIILELCAAGLLDPSVCALIRPGDTSFQLPASCPLVVHYNIRRSARLCTELDRNEACYGSEEVEFTPDNLAVAPGDIVELPPVIAIDVDGYNLNTARYGFSVAVSHANLHLEVDGGLRMLIFGSMRVEDAIRETEAVILPDEPIEVFVENATTLFDQPSSFGPQNPLGQIPSDSTALVDAFSEDGAWARVPFVSDTPIGTNPNAWIATDNLEFPGDFDPDTLPKMEATSLTSMQGFYFSPGNGMLPECAPGLGNTLLLQAPRGVETTFIANDANILITDTVELRFANGDDDLELRVISGVAVINAGTEEAQVVAPGYAVRIEQLEQLQNLGADGLANDYTLAINAQWSEPFEMSTTVMQQIASFETIPLSLLNQLIDAPLCGVDTQGDDCEIEYDFADDAALVEKLCVEGLLTSNLEVCE